MSASFIFAPSSNFSHYSSRLLSFIFTLIFAIAIGASEGWTGDCSVAKGSSQGVSQECNSDAAGAVCITLTGNPAAVTNGNGRCGCIDNLGATDTISKDCPASRPYCAANGECTSVSSSVGALLDDTNNDGVSTNKLVKVLCNAYAMIVGTGGKTLAAFAIISAGIGFFTGKVSWGLLIGIAAGIGAMFGAPSIVAAISGDTVDVKCKNLAR